MYILMYKLKDLLFGWFVVFFLVFVFVVLLVIYYYLVKEIVFLESNWINFYYLRIKLDWFVDKVDFLLDRIDELKYEIEE